MRLTTKANIGILLSAVIISTLFTSVSVLFLNNKKADEVHQIEFLVRTMTEGVRPNLAHEIFEGLDESILLRIKNLKSVKNIHRINLYDNNGFLLSQVGPPANAILPNAIFELSLHDYSLQFYKEESLILRYIQPIHAVNTLAGYLEIHYSLESLEQSYLIQYQILLAQILLFLIFLFASLNLTLRRVFLKPLTLLSDFTHRLETSGPGAVIRLNRQDEIGELAKSLDSMSLALAESQEQIHSQQEKLLQTQRLLDNIINSMPSILIGLNEEGRILQWNKAAEDKTQRSFSDVEGELIWEVLPFVKNLDGAIQKALSYRTIQENQHFSTVDQGLRTSYNATVYPLTATGEFGVVLRLDDVTEKRRIEEKMMQSEKLASVGSLAAGMAHEINNPLAGIIQSAQVLDRRLLTNQQANDKAAREAGIEMDKLHVYMEKRGVTRLLHSIRDSGSRAARIVENMLNFSSHTGFSFAENDLEFLVKSAVDMALCDFELRKLEDFEKLKVDIQTSDDLPHISCDGTQIQQVFLNIIKNAIQAVCTKQKSEVCTENDVIEFVLWKEADNVIIRIRDNGPGMSQQVQKRAFDPFFTTREVGRGAGLGLSVAYFIVTENHNGTMAIESEMNFGTEITISLPIQQE